MEVMIHKQIESLEKLMPRWKQLNKEFHDITVFQDIEWIKSWWEYKQKERKITPYIVEIKKGDKTIGIVPLYRYNKEFAGLPFRVLKPIGFELSDYLIPIISKGHSSTDIVKKALEKIYADKNNWDCLDWEDVPENSIFDSILKKEFNVKPKLKKRKKINVCPHLEITGGLETVMSKFNKKFLKGLLYYERKLKREGELKFHKVENEQEIDTIMNVFFKLHRKRWKNTSTPSKFEDTKEREF